jgi:diguanylate cyclase (GGDEF)-like protein/PAS domain S-box-containing protein
MILTSVVLIIITASFAVFSYLNLISQFRYERTLTRQRQSQEIKGLIDQSLLRIQHLAELIQDLTDMSPALLAREPSRLHAAFDQHWTELQLQFGLDFARIYDDENRLLAAWGKSGLPESEDTPVPNWIQEANQYERPVKAFDCAVECALYAIVPMLAEGQHIGAVLLGSPLTDIVLDFKQISGADVGVLITDKNNTAAIDTDRRIKAWQSSVVALTDWKRNLKLLRDISAHYQQLHKFEVGLTTDFEGRSYEINLLPLAGEGHTANGRFVVISDITQQLENIRDATRDNLILGGLGLVFSELLLVALLWTPMTRLRQTAVTLPLLGVGAFERARHAIRERTRNHWFRDEIDELDDTAIALSQRLEQLEYDVTERTRALSDRMDELRRERDFVNSLLNTAQVVVLTQDKSHQIRMINQYGESLSGFHRREVVNVKNFDDFIGADSYLNTVAEKLDNLAVGKQAQFRHEAPLQCRDGSKRDIAWLHSRLGILIGNAPVILSIGLDITEQKQAEQNLAWLADHDSLTGLYNRRRFQHELERSLAEAKRYAHEGALLFCDLDQFKYINDTSGHQAGDMLLKVVSNTLSHLVRDTDIVGRLGGDEFGVVITRTDKEGAINIANKINKALSEVLLPVGERSYRVSVSIGIALYPAHGINVHDLLANADLSMYQAKELGRNRWYVFSDQDQGRERMRAQVYWKEQVEQALVEDRFVLHYQPIMNLETNQITHVEALLRMVDVDNNLIRPAAFIDACERSGLIHAIDHLVLRKGIQQVAYLDAAGKNIRVSLNLSGCAFDDPELLSTLSALLKQMSVNPARLIFEITETAAVSDFMAARSLMDSIRQMGCSFALDDFGSGFSSLRYLNQLPADYVKIDGSFIRNLCNSQEQQVLVKAVTDVAKGFGKKTVAEFVDGDEVLRMLKTFGVDFAQGYFVGRPTSAEDLFSSRATTLTRDSLMQS